MSTRSTNQEAHQPMLTDGSAVTRRKYPSHGKHPSSPYTDALQQWKSTRSRLGAIIQEYLDACTTLKDVCAQPPPSPSDERWLDPVLIAVNSELPSILSDESKMLEARKQLGIARNYSPSLVPINRLPSEVLTQIFGHVLALNGCYVPDPPRTKPSEPADEYTRQCLTFHSTTLDVISGVSTYWRQLAINTPAFWTHLDFNLCDDDSRDRGVVRTKCFISRAELWISRTRGCPLSVHIFDHGIMTDGDSPYYQVLRLLTKHLSRIAVLSLEVEETYLIQMILSGLLCRGSPPSSLKTLVCKFPRKHAARSIEPLYETPRNDEVPSASTLDGFFASLHTLHLTNGLAQWSGRAYSGLVDLKIWGENFPEDKTPTLTQLENMLRASPKLRTLKLGAMKFGGSVIHNPPSQPAAILNDLEVLDLAWMGSSSLGLLLPRIVPGKRPLTMSAKVFHNHTEALDALRRFFGMAKIVRLQMVGRNNWHTVFCHLYDRLPDLEVLVLDSQHTHWKDPNMNSFDLIEDNLPSISPSAYYPKLDILYLRGGTVDSSWLRRLLANHSVRELHLDCVDLASRKVPYPSNEWQDAQRASLKQLVPCVKDTIRSVNRDDVVSLCYFAW